MNRRRPQTDQQRPAALRPGYLAALTGILALGMEVLETAMAFAVDEESDGLLRIGLSAAAVEAMQEGAFHYLEKPIDLDKLEAVVRRALERHDRKMEAALAAQDKAAY